MGRDTLLSEGQAIRMQRKALLWLGTAFVPIGGLACGLVGPAHFGLAITAPGNIATAVRALSALVAVAALVQRLAISRRGAEVR